MVRKSSDFLRATLAENIKAFRKGNGLSQEELAERCDLHRTYIGSVERHERNVTLSTLEALSETLGVTVPELLTKREIGEIVAALRRLTPAQQQWVKATILAFGALRQFWRAPDSDIVTQTVLDNFGDRLMSHHAGSRQALSKDRFEFALEAVLNDSGTPVRLVKSRTNRGHDITIAGTLVSLKTEAGANIRDDSIHVSKWMELGKGEWKLPLLRQMFLEHMRSYGRIFTLRCLDADPKHVSYELVEIPKALMLEASNCQLEVRENSRQNPKPGYGYVRDAAGQLKYALYFDGGTERKLQIKSLRKDLCKVHATWIFGSTTP
ncbi:MAG: helix-turn-helix domain-containing protein [Sulfuritalea sp.]|nr:helix-turn-helix domain-containing protein [Sulfuritalea sp.]